MLQSKTFHLLRCGTNKTKAFRLAGPGEFRILTQEPVARMNGLSARLPGDSEYLLHVQITVAWSGGSNLHRFSGHLHMARRHIGLGINRDGRKSEPVEGANDAAGNGSAIGDENFHEWWT